MMMPWMQHCLMAGLLGGAAALLAWGLCAVLRRARAPGWLLCLVWLAVGLRFALPGGVIPVTLPEPRDPELARAAETVTRTVQTLTEPPAPAGEAPVLVLLPTRAPASDPPAWAGVVGAVWLGGAVFLLARAAAGSRRLHRQLRCACRTPDGCYSSPAVQTPFTLGVLRPRIYLPAGLDGEARAAVLLHEQTHIRRGDMLTKPLFYGVVCLHWWNPLAWLAFRQFERAMEQACDEAAVRGRTEAQRARYCECLLHFALRTAPPGALAFGQSGARVRILHALRYRAPGRLALGLCVAAAMAAGFVLLAQPSLAQTPETPVLAAEPAATALPDASASSDAPVPGSAAAAPAPGEPAADAPGTAEAPAFEPVGGFILPVDYTYISRFYSLVHKGDDLIAPRGTPVLAAADGQVTRAGYHYSYGNYVVIDHGLDSNGHRWTTLYAHLAAITVREGQAVAQGESIGMVGSTGNSTSNHLHLELQCDGSLVPPQYYLPYSGTLLGKPDADGSLLALLQDPAMLDLAVQKAGAAQLRHTGAFRCPLSSYSTVSQLFGDDPAAPKPHTGLDLAAETGTPVLAAADGVVLAAGYDPDKGYYLLLYHGIGDDGAARTTLYSQLQGQTPLAIGTMVQAGQVLGAVGNSGMSTGPHLHLELWRDGTAVDPAGEIPC